MREDVLVSWSIYHRYPGAAQPYVAVKFLIYEEPIPTAETISGATIEEVRKLLPPGLFPFIRSPTDDPTLVETWL